MDERFVKGSIESLEVAYDAIQRSIGILSAVRTIADEKTAKLIDYAIEYLENALSHIKGMLLDLYDEPNRRRVAGRRR